MDATDRWVTIASGGTISDYIPVRSERIGIEVPTIDAGITYVRAALDPNGVTSGRIQKEDGSAVYTIASGVGAVNAVLPFRFPFNYIAVETATAQDTGAVVFRITAKE